MGRGSREIFFGVCKNYPSIVSCVKMIRKSSEIWLDERIIGCYAVLFAFEKIKKLRLKDSIIKNIYYQKIIYLKLKKFLKLLHDLPVKYALY